MDALLLGPSVSWYDLELISLKDAALGIYPATVQRAVRHAELASFPLGYHTWTEGPIGMHLGKEHK